MEPSALTKATSAVVDLSFTPLLKMHIIVVHMNFVYNLLTVYMHSIATCAIYHYFSYSVEILYKNEIEFCIYSHLQPDDGKHFLLKE